MKRYQVSTVYLQPRLAPRSRTFWTRRGAENFARLFDREAWRLGWLTVSVASKNP